MRHFSINENFCVLKMRLIMFVTIRFAGKMIAFDLQNFNKTSGASVNKVVGGDISGKKKNRTGRSIQNSVQGYS